jgi:putative ABC transport system permease protein
LKNKIMDSLINDLRYGIRNLIARPGFTSIAVITLALGIGANTAIFSVVNATLLRPLPFKDPDRIVMVRGYIAKLSADNLPSSAGNYLAVARQSQTFQQLTAFRQWTWQLTHSGEPEQLQGVRVSANFFEAVGASPALGQTFTAEQDQEGAAPVTIISNRLWHREFAADPNVVGKSLILNGRRVTVIGVMPRDFEFPGGANMNPGLQFATRNDIWMPLQWSGEERGNQGNLNLAVLGRLKPGVTVAQAEIETRAIESGLPLAKVGYTVNLVPLQKQMVGNIRRLLLVLLATVVFVMLIACANVANLLLARASARRKEMAIRGALGAGRGRIVRQLLTESLLLSSFGGLVGLLIAIWATPLLVSFIPEEIPRIHEINVDLRVLGFTLVISIISGIVFGLAPALQTLRIDLNESLKESARSISGSLSQNRMRAFLVIGEVSLAVVLMIGAALLIKSFIRLMDVKPGFDPSQTLTMEVSLPALPPSKYAKESEQAAFFEQALDRLSRTPGVTAAGAVVSLPLTGAEESTDLFFEGRPRPPAGQRPQADYTIVTPDYFRALAIPLLKGREFSSQDRKDAPMVIIVNEELARRHFPNEEPLGKRINVGFEDFPREIVGIVGGIKQSTLAGDFQPAMYIPYQQRPANGMSIVVRTTGDPMSVAAAARDQIHSVDVSIPVTNIRTMDQIFSESVVQQRFSMLLVGLFGALALVLAAIGIYGVMAYTVTQRKHEIAVRMALGAKRRQVVQLILKDGLLLASFGVGFGLIGAFALTRLMASLLFEVKPTDIQTFATVSALLILIALAACLLPARRATRVDPLVALRYE